MVRSDPQIVAEVVTGSSTPLGPVESVMLSLGGSTTPSLEHALLEKSILNLLGDLEGHPR